MHNARLGLEPSHLVIELDKVAVNIVFDIEVDCSTIKVYGIPLLSFKNVNVQPLNSALQLHGIVVAKVAGKDCHERVGYFWSANEKVIKDISTQGYCASKKLVGGARPAHDQRRGGDNDYAAKCGGGRTSLENPSRSTDHAPPAPPQRR
jgi:hypothetical protein